MVSNLGIEFSKNLQNLDKNHFSILQINQILFSKKKKKKEIVLGVKIREFFNIGNFKEMLDCKKASDLHHLDSEMEWK